MPDKKPATKKSEDTPLADDFAAKTAARKKRIAASITKSSLSDKPKVTPPKEKSKDTKKSY